MPTDQKKTATSPVTAPATTPAGSSEKSDRRIVVERRAVKERRRADKPVAVERREPEERRKVERRINEYPMSPEVLEFINALNHFKSVNQKPFPTWSEIFEIFTGLGYHKPD
jgi:hypothetical protein